MATGPGCNAPIAVITGGTGLVGTALARQLAFDVPDHQLVLLARRPAQIEVPRATAVYADVARPDLGLDVAVRRMRIPSHENYHSELMKIAVPG